MTVGKRIIKVAMCGAQGTGKTTAARELRDWADFEFPGLRVVMMDEVARSCPWAINEGASPEAQRWIFHQQICAELEAGREADVLICDRSALDNLIYSLWCQKHSWTSCERGWVKAYLGLFEQDWLPTYDLVWLFSVDRTRPIAVDGVRSINRDFQLAIDRLMEEICFNLPADNGLVFDWIGLEAAQRELEILISGLDEGIA